MFNRRMLRIKAMQYLFAFFKQKLAIMSLSSSQVWEKEYVNQQLQENFRCLKEGLQVEVIKIKRLFIHFLELLIKWAHLDEVRSNTLLTPPHSTLCQNHLLKKLEKNKIFSIISPLQAWSEDLVQTWYNQCLKKHPSFILYTAKSFHTNDEDKNLVLDIIKKIILKHKDIQKYASFEDICWSENKPIVQRLLLTFIKELSDRSLNQSIPASLEPLAEEKLFYENLIEKTVEQATNYQTCIAKNLKNWDLERITFLDQILIKMALTELIHFQKTPKSVVMNEYLEIAKKYSSPKSHLFINGVTEVVMNELAVN